MTTTHDLGLAALPDGQRQRIVVVPDDVMDAEQGLGPETDGGANLWRPWSLLHRDPQHPVMKALKEAEEEGLDLRPVRQSTIGELAMPVGHPLPATIYIGSPAVPARYYPVADFHRRVFEERFSEAVLLLMALGAEQFSVHSKQGWSREMSAKLDIPFHAVVKAGGETTGKHNKKAELLFTARLDPRQPEIPNTLVWYQHEASWRSIAEGRMKYGLRDFSLAVTSREDYGIDSEIATKLHKRKALSLGGNFTQQIDTTWVFEGTFGEAARRGGWWG
jgi:hypothetical protein